MADNESMTYDGLKDRASIGTVVRFTRMLNAALEALPPDIPTPTHVSVYTFRDPSPPEIEWLYFGDKASLDAQKQATQAVIRAVGGKWDKRPGELYEFSRELLGVRLHISVDREAVCRRVVTGTREVTEKVPAPDAPLVEVVRTVEDVEWQCEPLLAEATA